MIRRPDLELHVEDLCCTECAVAVEKALARRSGVKHLRILAAAEKVRPVLAATEADRPLAPMRRGGEGAVASVCWSNSEGPQKPLGDSFARCGTIAIKG